MCGAVGGKNGLHFLIEYQEFKSLFFFYKLIFLPPHLRYHDTIERYCSKTDTWEIVGEMPSSRSWLSCVTLPLRRDLPSEDSMELTNT